MDFANAFPNAMASQMSVTGIAFTSETVDYMSIILCLSSQEDVGLFICLDATGAEAYISCFQRQT